jgi:hypothetical protein
MNSIVLDNEAMAAIAEVIRKRLIRGQPVAIPGVGTLKVAHSPSEVVQGEGTASITPPRDFVVFEQINQRIPA